MSEFLAFRSIPRLTRDCIITEKCDGTNAQVYIDVGTPIADGYAIASFERGNEVHTLYAGSRNRWISPQADNFGFAKWVQEHAAELVELGPGRHFGEWIGRGIQRGYGLPDKRWLLFNVARWCLFGETPRVIPTLDPRITRTQECLPPCCALVPVLYEGVFRTDAVDDALRLLEMHGSYVNEGFKEAEGVVVYHTAGGVFFKKTLGNDGNKSRSDKE